ncbi:WYL domain-containing protein [Nocardioides sp. zg-ZUI104]|uniref:helix-turn-helix transcriptional regulator n=1 Tax=Nocardioides faecalis TaxID=2803858 RepID=UPI001BCD00B6|nr:WYL domain-containing protein [Nocardioides faecalis]MBS4752717.1 WYL domain-containing protein [Nocardioides faecalis]
MSRSAQPPTPRYVARIARLPRVFERLTRHPDGVALATLAADLGAEVEELREDLLAFYTADVDSDWLLGLGRPEVLEFLGPDGVEQDPNAAEVVRIVTERPAELGVEHVDAGELALVHAAAMALLEIEPDDTALREAIDVLTETMLGPAAGSSGEPQHDQHLPDRHLPVLQQAQREHTAVRILYSRDWAEGVTEREIEPYRLVRTRRGWEVDAGPADEAGNLRTYLISNLRTVSPTDRRFTPPADLDERLAAQRATTTVRVLLPQSARWVADLYAERVTVVDDDEESVVVDLELLPPLERRVGRLLLAAGTDAFVVDPPELEAGAVTLASELLEHHGG